jgi:hypothetical protein
MTDSLWISDIQISPLAPVHPARKSLLAVVDVVLNQEIRLCGLQITQNSRGQLFIKAPFQDKITSTHFFYRFLTKHLKNHIEKWVISEWNLFVRDH